MVVFIKSDCLGLGFDFLSREENKYIVLADEQLFTNALCGTLVSGTLQKAIFFDSLDAFKRHPNLDFGLDPSVVLSDTLP